MRGLGKTNVYGMLNGSRLVSDYGDDAIDQFAQHHPIADEVAHDLCVAEQLKDLLGERPVIQTPVQIGQVYMPKEATMHNPVMIAAPIDLEAPAKEVTLDDLLLRDDVIVDVWDTEDHNGEAHVFLVGEDGVLEPEPGHTVDEVIVMVAARLRRGWGREGALPEDVVHVEPFRPDFEHPAASVFAQARREPFSTWRVVESAVAAKAVR